MGLKQSPNTPPNGATIVQSDMAAQAGRTWLYAGRTWGLGLTGSMSDQHCN